MECQHVPFLLQNGGISVFKDINILANHLHGFYGSMGTDSPPCDPTPEGAPCYRGDNIFADIEPGQCAYYQYDFSLINSPGALWYAARMTVSVCVRFSLSCQSFVHTIQCLWTHTFRWLWYSCDPIMQPKASTAYKHCLLFEGIQAVTVQFCMS